MHDCFHDVEGCLNVQDDGLPPSGTAKPGARVHAGAGTMHWPALGKPFLIGLQVNAACNSHWGGGMNA